MKAHVTSPTPSVVTRLCKYTGLDKSKDRCTPNPNTTVREAIELADYIHTLEDEVQFLRKTTPSGPASNMTLRKANTLLSLEPKLKPTGVILMHAETHERKLIESGAVRHTTNKEFNAMMHPCAKAYKVFRRSDPYGKPCEGAFQMGGQEDEFSDWFVQVHDFTEFVRNNGKIVLSQDANGEYEIEIYDSYRE